MKTFRSMALPAAAAALLLTGCGGAAPPDGGSYANVTDLKDAFVKAGGTCDDWSTHNKSILADSAGACGDAYALSVYDDMEKMKLWVDAERKMSRPGAVVGKNWTISGINPKPVHDKLGGELISK
jgi:hypothetical protein